MAQCSWPTCRSEATNGSMCYMHYRVYGNTSMADKPEVDEKERQRLFKENRKKYLDQHSICEVKDCKAKATDVHHKRGRLGKLLYDITHFFATCRKHHKQIEKDPKWAKSEGYSESRLSK